MRRRAEGLLRWPLNVFTSSAKPWMRARQVPRPVQRSTLVVSPAVACLSGLKSAPRKRVRGNPPRVQIPPPPPTDKSKRLPRHEADAGVRGLGLIFGSHLARSFFCAVCARPEQHIEPSRHVAVNRSNDVCERLTIGWYPARPTDSDGLNGARTDQRVHDGSSDPKSIGGLFHC